MEMLIKVSMKLFKNLLLRMTDFDRLKKHLGVLIVMLSLR